MFKKATAFAAAALAAGAVVPAYAQNDTTENAKLRAEIAELRAEVGQTRLETSRANEVKNMISEVLEDSESRRSLSASGAVAGHDGGFFLSSADGKFFMGISGKIKIRFYANFREDNTTGAAAPGTHEVTTGFDLTEATLDFSGHVFSEDIKYYIAMDLDNSGTVITDSVGIGYTGFFDGLEVIIGYGFEQDMTLEQSVSDTKQSAVHRSLVSGIIDQAVGTGGGDVGISAFYSQEYFKVGASFLNNDSLNWDTNSGYLLSGRLDIKLMGTWDQTDDFASWSGEDVLLVFGAGVQLAYSTDDANSLAGGATDDDDWTLVGWTVDARFEWNGVSAFVSGMGLHGNTSGTGLSFDIYGVVGQVSYNIMDTVELFVRGEGLIMSNQSQGTGFSGWGRDGGVGIVTVGGTWFLYGHDLKVTADVGFATDDIPNDYAGAGYLTSTSGTSDDTELQVVIRVQVQLLF